MSTSLPAAAMLRVFLLRLFAAALMAVVPVVAAHADNKCGDTATQAVERATSALEASSPADDRQALRCLLEAVTLLDAKIEGLRAGDVPFTGPANLHRGGNFKRSPDQEAR